MGKRDDAGESPLVVIRPLISEYIDAYLDQFSPSVREILHVSCVESEREYLMQRVQAHEQQQTFFTCIFEQLSNQLIGAIEIRDAQAFAGQLYCWIHEQFWGKGHFYQAMHLAAQNYFTSTNAHEFSAHVDVSNERCACALKKCGFEHVGFHNGPYGEQYRLICKKRS